MLDLTNAAPRAVNNLVRPDKAFKVFAAPLYDHAGHKIDERVVRGVYRDDTNEVIATCGAAFKPVQHYQALDPVLDYFEGAGYAIEERKPTRHGLYDLAGKKGVFLTTGFAKNGAVMRTDIITGDFIQPTGSTGYLDKGPDTMLFKISVLNSHDGSLAVHINTSYERLICMNGMTRPSFKAGVYGKHTQNFSIEAMKRQIDNALSAMEADADTFGLWATTRLSQDKAAEVLKKTIAKQKARGQEPSFSERFVTAILDRFAREDQTVWGLYQAVTWWQTHAETKANSNALTTLINRENRVAQMLRTEEWKALAA
ncbi:DUF932 domain-containing protein [Rhodobacter lacus]|uniref:DUF932 domain-containing protein n=1 Tax=Rhodobacter lacus TaxID=1641972 RepID=A0ABW5ADT9_9RHOB